MLKRRRESSLTSHPEDLVNLIFNWLSVSSFYLAFYFLISSSISGSSDPFGGAGDEIFQVFNKVYIGLM
jgi:chitin synthase